VVTVKYARGLELGDTLRQLASAGITFTEIDIPLPAVSEGEDHIYLIEQAHLRDLGDSDALTILVRTNSLSETLDSASYPNVIARLGRPIDPAALLSAVRTAEQMYSLRSEMERILDSKAHTEHESAQLLNIGVALSAERDIAKLQSLIVRKARELTNADSGSLFLIEEIEGECKLRFAVAQTGPTDEEKHLGAVLDLSRSSISGNVAITGETLRIPDATLIGDKHEYRFNPSFDQANNYRTKSVLCAPMRDHKHEVIGVIQLINRKPSFDVVLTSRAFTEQVVTEFDEHDERVLASLASQAGVALENNRLIEAIQDLFEQFVRASVKAIEVRDVATQGHSERVARLTVAQAKVLNEIQLSEFEHLKFDPEQLREMRYAALLHDFGKVAVPEYIFGKAKKLPDGRLDTIRMRFLLAIEQLSSAAAQQKFELLRQGVPPGDPQIAAIELRTEQAKSELAALLVAVESANEPAIVAADTDNALAAVMKGHYRDHECDLPLLDSEELAYLQIPRGSLSESERERMQEHVTQSYRFLAEIPWKTTPWQNVAELAHAHHEHLDGTGYPRKLRGDAIVPQVRMITIADIFDALTAGDRPYKRAIPLDRALDILTNEFARRGKIDPLLLDVFIQNRVYEAVSVR